MDTERTWKADGIHMSTFHRKSSTDRIRNFKTVTPETLDGSRRTRTRKLARKIQKTSKETSERSLWTLQVNRGQQARGQNVCPVKARRQASARISNGGPFEDNLALDTESAPDCLTEVHPRRSRSKESSLAERVHLLRVETRSRPGCCFRRVEHAVHGGHEGNTTKTRRKQTNRIQTASLERQGKPA